LAASIQPDKSPTTHAQDKNTDHSRSPVRSWIAVIAIGLGVFTVTSTEMMPIGLLPGIASDLGVSEGQVGLSVTLYGIFAGALAPLLTAASRRLDRRHLLLVVLAVFVVGNVLTALATNYVLLMLCRLAIGFIHGVMWAIVASIAVRLVPAALSVRATAIVFSGISLASVLGVPFGTFIGEWLDWRAAFWGLALCSCVAFLAIAVLMPPMEPLGGVHLSELPGLLKVTNLRVAVAVTAIVVIGNFAAYTYVTPFLMRNVGIEPNLISALLLCYGAAGVAGNFVAGLLVGRNRPLRRVILTLIAGLSAAIALLLAAGTWKLGAIAFLLAWGVTYAALPVALQTLVFRSAPRAREAATSIYVMAFNVSIALGALFGGVAIDTAGTFMPMAVGIMFCLIALIATTRLRSDQIERS
jgi:predicted MFS family arabinose efflux permease